MKKIKNPIKPVVKTIETKTTIEKIKLIGLNTLVEVYSKPSDSIERGDTVVISLGEAINSGLLSTCRETIFVKVELAESERADFWNQPLQWFPDFQSYGVTEPEPEF